MMRLSCMLLLLGSVGCYTEQVLPTLDVSMAVPGSKRSAATTTDAGGSDAQDDLDALLGKTEDKPKTETTASSRSLPIGGSMSTVESYLRQITWGERSRGEHVDGRVVPAAGCLDVSATACCGRARA